MGVHNVEESDEDYLALSQELRETTTDGDHGNNDVVFGSVEATAQALRGITGDDYLSSLVSPNEPIGFAIWKDATSPSGVSLKVLAAWAAAELRIRDLAVFLDEYYPDHLLRERQDSKVRYEVSSLGVRITRIFAAIEANKGRLRLADYGVSQTSLEQVFNMHAAEAEKLKHGRMDS